MLNHTRDELAMLDVARSIPSMNTERPKPPNWRKTKRRALHLLTRGESLSGADLRWVEAVACYCDAPETRALRVYSPYTGYPESLYRQYPEVTECEAHARLCYWMSQI